MSKNGYQTPQQLIADLDVHPFADPQVMTSTTDSLPGYRIVRVIGTVYGLTVRAKNISSSIGTMVKGLGGGELRSFTTMLYSAHNEALARAVGECLQLKGNAMVGVKFENSSLAEMGAVVCASGTAVVVEIIEDE